MKVKVIEKAMPNSEFSLLQNDEMNEIKGSNSSCSPYATTVGCYILHECGTTLSVSGAAYTKDTLTCFDFYSWKEWCLIAGRCLLG